MDVIRALVAVLGAGVIVLVCRFFFFKGEKGVRSTDGKILIEVKGGYTPRAVEAPFGRKTTLIFRRTDPSACLEEVVLPDFKIRKRLPVGEAVAVEIEPKARGEFPFSCGMRMYHGKVVVV